MIEVPEVWRLVELNQVHKYILSHGYGGEPYPDKVKKSEKKLISETKRILNINVDRFCSWLKRIINPLILMI